MVRNHLQRGQTKCDSRSDSYDRAKPLRWHINHPQSKANQQRPFKKMVVAERVEKVDNALEGQTRSLRQSLALRTACYASRSPMMPPFSTKTSRQTASPLFTAVFFSKSRYFAFYYNILWMNLQAKGIFAFGLIKSNAFLYIMCIIFLFRSILGCSFFIYSPVLTYVFILFFTFLTCC